MQGAAPVPGAIGGATLAHAAPPSVRCYRLALRIGAGPATLLGMLTHASRTATMRTSEIERQRVADFLRDGCADGRLSPEELDERLGLVWAGRTVADLQRAVWDLPGGDSVLPRLFPRGRTAPPPARRRAARPAGLAVLMFLGLAVVVLAALPDFMAWTMLALLVGVAVATLLLALALAPAALIGLAIAWIAGRLFRGRMPGHPWAPGGRRFPPF
jgi:hypothetical protein